MLDCPYENLKDDEFLQMMEIFRNCLMGKKAIAELDLRNTDVVSEGLKDSYHLGILLLNLGAISREPYLGGNWRFPSWLRRDKDCRDLPHLIFRDNAHITCLCEAVGDHGGITIHEQLAKEHSKLGMLINAETLAPSLAIFVRGSHEQGTFIELIVHHQSMAENKEPQNQFWLIHGCIFRTAFGRTTATMVDPTTGIRTKKPTDMTPNKGAAISPHPAPLATTKDSPDVQICEIDGLCAVQSADLKPQSGADTHDVRRLGLSDTRIAVFHANSWAWNNAYSECCEKWLHFVAACMEHQADFIAGDGNQFCQRNFKTDWHSDFRSSIMIDILERFLGHINLHRSALNKISYNLVSATQAGMHIRAMEGDPEADCDSMILISLCYGKQTVVSEDRGRHESASADGVAGSPFDDAIILGDVEQAKHLMTYDLGLTETDAA